MSNQKIFANLRDRIQQSFPDGCEQIAAAVTSMGVPTAANAAVATIVANIKKIVTKITGNATPARVLAGATFYSTNAKTKQTGTMPERAGWSASAKPGETVTIPAGHHDGTGSVTVLGGTQHKFLEAWGESTDAHACTTDILDNTARTISSLKLVTLTLDNKKYVPDYGQGSQTPKGTLIIKNNVTDTEIFKKEITNSATHGDSASSIVTFDFNNQLVDVSQCDSVKISLDLRIGYNIGILTLDYYAQQ